MVLYVLSLGVALFALLAVGITMIELGGASDAAQNVIIVTASANSTLSAPSVTSSLETPPTKALPSSVPASGDRLTVTEDTVTDLVNRERAKAGCTQMLHTDERLRAAARGHSEDMARNNYFSHVSRDGSTFVDRIAGAGYPKRDAAAENIAYGYATPADVMKGWMNSEGHRTNILNCSYKAIGVGVAYRGNTPYWTQDFGRS
jgi:uncharacterized protein YkwD